MLFNALLQISTLHIMEASRVPAEWHGWLHHIVDTPPTLETTKFYRWEKPHEPNLTGSALAYRPPGSVLNPKPSTPARADYEPWRPE